MEKELPARLSPGEGRRFAFPVGGAFLALAGLAWWRGHPGAAAVPALIGGLLLAAGLFAPGRLGPVYRAWMGFALILSRVTTPIFMGVVFFLVIAPIGIVMRIAGRNPLRRSERERSFWISRPSGPDRHSDMRRQF